ncbi:HERV-H LTR-associating protein 1 [Camelus dromedarius]|uniref:HERV-H LTR-associating protein 1 n=1 Tax=Camelus dromedarius TaxID=9838 RepID=A0A5N4CH39_CAMDR|nr:HERV-H LTR-associating protein 1 [Camelus dromedarius]
MPGFLLRGPPARLCVGLACVLSLWNTVSAFKGEAKKENAMTFLPTTVSSLRGEEKREKGVAFLGTTVGICCLFVSLSLAESTKFFSLLSITSYSSFAFHKFAVAIYNRMPCGSFPFLVSHLRPVDLARFPARYCYCLNNGTNDLSDFTALLVDVIGNSTSYLTEIFKADTIILITTTTIIISFLLMPEALPLCFCVQWMVTVITAVLLGSMNLTFLPFGLIKRAVELSPLYRGIGRSWGGTHPPLAHRLRVLPRLRPPDIHRQVMSLPGGPLPLEKRQLWSQDPTRFQVRAGTPSLPWFVSALDKGFALGCPEPSLRDGAMTATPLTLAIQELNPCLMELCRFFQQCLCMSQKRDPRMEAVR